VKALAAGSTRTTSYAGAGVVAALAALSGYVVARSETGFAVLGGLILASTAVVWLLAAESRQRSARRARSTEDSTIELLRVPRVAFLSGLLLIGQLTVRPLYSTTASDVLFLAALVSTLGGLLLSRQRRLGFVPLGLTAGAALFAIGACISAFSSATTGASIGIALRFLYLTLIWVWVATIVLRRRADVRVGVAFWVVSLSASGAAAIAQFLLGEVVPGTETAYGRMTGTAQHVNDLGGSAAVALPAAVALMLMTSAGRPLRLVGVIGTVLITSGLVLSGSIGAMIATAVGVGVAAVVTGRTRAFGVAAVVISVAALATSYLQPAHSAGTLANRIDAVSGPSGTLEARIEVFRLAWDQIAESPLIGVGLGFDPRAADAALPDLIHNAFLNTWYQGGLFALVGLVLIGLTALSVGRRTVKGARTTDDRLLAGSLLGSFVAYVAFGLGTPALYERYGWVPVALFMALRAIQLRQPPHDGEPAA
jgi:O-antigen ligase